MGQRWTAFLARFFGAAPPAATNVASPKRLIVGLGNPGAEYDGTRHNVGFEVIDVLADQLGDRLREGKGNALMAEGRWRGRNLAIAKPLTYMNRSGQSVRALMRHYGLMPDDVLIVYDDLNLPIGTIRVRPKGSAGGHNGVQDIIDRLGSSAFPRLRIGIGSNFGRGRQIKHVLGPFDADERPLIDDAIDRSKDAALTFITDGVVTTMNRFNQKG
ncbi:MAG: aminoacyl-tRNA hydrolase [Rhodothermales bacterium]